MEISLAESQTDSPANIQRRHNVVTTSLQKDLRRCNDVVVTLCVSWELLSHKVAKWLSKKKK